MKKHLLALILIVFTGTLLYAQYAFPGAEGYGKYTVGGRGGKVYEVTNLNDNGPGSLRAAVEASGPRTVVFRVSGTIILEKDLKISSPYITIAGQTAPGDGICLRKYPLVIGADQVVIRYIRVRFGDETGIDADAVSARGVKNVVIDHVSASWSVDETMSVYHCDNVTIQWCIIAESMYNSNHIKGAHGFGGIWGSNNSSYHHNLIAHNSSRNPRMASGTGNFDYRNNVVYNWGYNSTYGGEQQQAGDPDHAFTNINMVANYYKPGPATQPGNVSYRLSNPSYRDVKTDYGKWYIADNVMVGNEAVTANNWNGGVQPSGGTGDIGYVKLNEPWPSMPINQQTPEDAYQSVLQHAGCSFPVRDVVDTRIIRDTRNGDATYEGVTYKQTKSVPDKTKICGIIDSQTDVGGWPTLNSAPAPTDTDHDGIPDEWELANGLNPNNAADANGIAPNGYTHLENYINGLVGPVDPTPISAIYSSFGFGKFVQLVGNPSAPQTFTVSGTGLTNNITVTAPANYQLSLNGTTWSTVLTLTQNGGSVPGTTVRVRLNASSGGIYNGNIVASSAGVSSIVIPVTGEASVSQKQVIGIFPTMEGGFENQPAGVVSNAAPTGAANPAPIVWTTTGNANIVSNGKARTGNNHFTYTSTSTSAKNNYSPAVSAPLFTNNLKYIVQFYYRAPAPNAGNQLASLIAMTDNTGTTNFNTNSTYQSPINTNNAWQKYTGVQSLNVGYTPNTAFGGFRFNGGGIAIAQPFDIDDFVVYPADNQASPAADITPPDPVTTPATTAALNNIDISWTAPSTGVDGGGYVVVRSTSATPPALLANGLYSIGNTVSAGNTVVYIGAATTFTDNGKVAALAPGITYYYHIFTADKAFNYSPATTSFGALASVTLTAEGNMDAFSHFVGAPSASQQFALSGSFLSGDVTVTAPAGFEVSLDNDAWTASVTLSPENNVVDPSIIYVRLNAASPSSYSGNITVASEDASTVNVVVSGTACGITVPENISVSARAGQCSAVVHFNYVSSTPCGTVSSSHASGSVFGIGTTVVTLTATTGVTDTFTVTVTDDEKPVITHNGNKTVNNEPGRCGASVSVSASASDNCSSGISATGTRDDGLALNDEYPVGTTTITWTVTDAAGNTATETQTVTVMDSEEPVITAPSAVAAFTNNGCTATGVALGAPAVSDNCTTTNALVVTNDAPSAFPVGQTVVTWTVKDAAGNSATATQVVTVSDNVKPSITAPAAVQTVPNAAGCVAINVNLRTPATSDNCGVKTVTNNAPSSFPVGTTVVTWTVTDVNGNTATATQNVVVSAPVITSSVPDVYAVKNADANTIYIGYGPDSLTLTGVVSGGTAPYAYKWTSPTSAGHGLNNASLVVKPVSANTYVLNVKDIYGCTAPMVKTIINVLDVRCGTKNDRVSVCQVVKGKPTASCVAEKEVAALLANGVTLGACPVAATNSKMVQPEVAINTVGALLLKTSPNPASYQFTVFVSSASAEAIILRVTDILGRTVEVKNKVVPNSNLQLGAGYKAGVYLIEVQQGDERRQMKLIKQ